MSIKPIPWSLELDDHIGYTYSAETFMKKDPYMGQPGAPLRFYGATFDINLLSDDQVAQELYPYFDEVWLCRYGMRMAFNKFSEVPPVRPGDPLTITEVSVDLIINEEKADDHEA